MDCHHGALFVDAGHGRVDDGAALVNDPVKAQPLLFEIVQRQQCPVAAGLLVVGGKQVHVHGEHKAFCQQFLNGAKLRKQGSLGVHSASAPELAVPDDTGKGLFLPAAGCLHHIVVGHHHDIAALVGAPPFVQVGVITQNGKLCLFAQQGKEGLNHGPELEKLFRLKAVFFGNSPAPDHFRQTLGVVQVSFFQREIHGFCHGCPPFLLLALMVASTSASL